MKLYQQRTEKELRQNFFTICVVNWWNGLPAEVVESPTHVVFERRLDVALQEIEGKFNFRNDCSPIANQMSKSIAEGMTAADDLDM